MDRFEDGKVLAHFFPQAWINDYAVDIDGDCLIDVTNQIRDMSIEQALSIRDNSHESHQLWFDHPDRTDHNGTFRVECEQAIFEFLCAKYGKNVVESYWQVA
ncbi:MAG: hypothetical protein ABEL51_15675 [Salinibacter sp.]